MVFRARSARLSCRRAKIAARIVGGCRLAGLAGLWAAFLPHGAWASQTAAQPKQVTLPHIYAADGQSGHGAKPAAENKQAGRAAQTPQADAELSLEARLTADGPVLRQGIDWRIYGTNPGLDNTLPLIGQSAQGTAKFTLKPGNYSVFAAFGRAEQSKNITLEAGKTTAESFILNAGGLKLSATLPDGKINEKQLHFSVYPEGQVNEQKALIENAAPDDVIRLPAGTYHIVCNYGTANAIARTDIRIEAGKLTEAAMQQRAAQIILKLVRQKGGEALADTSWAIMNDSGDIVREIANANAYIILAEGNYVAVAKNKDQIYQKEFTVSSSKDEEIEVSATAQNSVDEDGID